MPTKLELIRDKNVLTQLLAAAHEQLAAAKRDGERLDWIEQYKRPGDYWSIRTMEQPLTLWLQSGCTSYPKGGKETMTIRQIIDVARQKEGK